MGLMAVFILVLLTLMWRQQDDVEDLRRQKEELEREKAALQAEKLKLEQEKQQIVEARKELARLFQELIVKAKWTIDQQDSAQRWIARLFEHPGCQLTLDDDFRLQPAQGPADLYGLGSTELSVIGQAQLASCRHSFRLLACALGTRPEGRLDPLCQRSPCGHLLDEWVIDEESKAAVTLIGQGLEAVVLEGNTDRIRPSRFRQIPAIGGLTAPSVDKTPWVPSFVENAHVGAERARQATGHLLHLVASEEDATGCSPPELLASRVRVESPSFGRTLVGPRFMRSESDHCPDDQDDCPNARNLSLRIRWTERELRRPINEIRQEFCKQLDDPKGPVALGLLDAGENLDELRRQLDCRSSGEGAP